MMKHTVHDYLIKYILKQPVHVWPNVVFALDQFLATYCCDGGICPNPMHARGVAIQPVTDALEILMKFYLFVGGAIEVTRVSSLSYWTYLQDANEQWSARTYYAATDDPPPYLGSLTTTERKIE